MMRKKTLYLNSGQVEAIKQRLAVIAQHELELALLRDGLQRFIEKQCGVDLDKQDWELNLDHNLLERQPEK
jgi:hypothetical protein